MARPRKRIELEDGLKLDLNKLCVQTISQGETTPRVICWDRRSSGGARTIGLLVWRFSSATRGSMRLLLRSLDQRIDLVALPRHFGGVQWYFVCPTTGRRASVLWMPAGESCFASRRAWGSQFAYASQFESPLYRAHSRAHEVSCRLSGKNYSEIYHLLPPPRPRYMHRDTYGKLLMRLVVAESKYKLHLEGLTERSNIEWLNGLTKYDFRNSFRLTLMLPGWRRRPGFGSPVRGKQTTSRDFSGRDEPGVAEAGRERACLSERESFQPPRRRLPSLLGPDGLDGLDPSLLPPRPFSTMKMPQKARTREGEKRGSSPSSPSSPI
jgi:hypothetical protein